jgi:DNA invertase Pin-like site-specific DNA recombinase
MRAALYVRCSTRDQHADVQLAPLIAYAERRGWEVRQFIDAAVSGRQCKRPGLDALLVAVRRREVDSVVITKLDRLFRSTRHLSALAAELEALGVHLVVIDQSIDTSTPAGKLLFNVLAAIGEFEADLIRERTLAGLDAARRRGKKLGRPKRVFNQRQVARVRRLRANGKSIRQIADLLEISKSMAHRIAKASHTGIGLRRP